MITSQLAIWPSRCSAWSMISFLALTIGMTSIKGLASAQSTEVKGTVKDGSGLAVKDAFVTLETSAAPSSAEGQRTAITDQGGAFRFLGVEPGTYKITIAALGFEAWRAVVGSGDNQPSLSAVLKVADASSSVDVTLSQHEVAAEQLKAEEKQRLLGVIPDFFVSYAPDAVPLTAAQKLQLGWRTIADPVSLIGTGISAGIQQGRNNYPEFGQGVEGYAKRFGAQYANRVSSEIVGHVLMQSIFRQDPRYFYKGTGSVRSRALYAIGTAFVRKGDNGRWQPDYTDVLGGIASHEISTLYYPSSSRPVRRLVDDVMLGFAGRAAHNLAHEFVLRKLTTHVPAITAGLPQRILPEGTPVSLISVEDWTSKTTESGGQIAFMLASDLQIDGVIVAPIGSKAWGHANFAGVPGSDAKAMQVGLDHVRLKLGGMDVPLRSTAQRAGDGQLEYHRLENSGRIALVLYVAENVTLPLAQ